MSVSPSAPTFSGPLSPLQGRNNEMKERQKVLVT